MTLDAALAEALRRIGTDRSTRRLRALGGAAGLMVACGYTGRNGGLHLSAWLRRHP